MNKTFYTDGSVLHLNGCGGFAAVPVHPDGSADVDHIISGAKASFDIQEMELIAVITAIRSVPKSHDITIFTDHKTICDVLARETRAKCEKGKNRNQWNQLRQLCRSRQISLNWVKAHAGCVGNVLADRAARGAAKALQQQLALAH